MKDLDTKKNIKIGYRTYAIEKNDRVWNKQTESYGQFLSKEGIICMSSEEDSISQANTLLHEILHGVVYQWVRMNLMIKRTSGQYISKWLRSFSR